MAFFWTAKVPPVSFIAMNSVCTDAVILAIDPLKSKLTWQSVNQYYPKRLHVFGSPVDFWSNYVIKVLKNFAVAKLFVVEYQRHLVLTVRYLKNMNLPYEVL